MSKAIGKIILMGEHAVVYGQPAIALPFKEVGIEVNIKTSTGPIVIKSKLYQGLLDAVPERLLGLQTVIKEVLKRFQKEPINFTIEINSYMPEERGLGSSASVSVATIRALYAYYHVNISNTELFELTQLAEKINHGNPSGIDAAVMTDESAIYYKKNVAFQPINLNLDATLIVADTGIKGRTMEAVNHIRKRIDKIPKLMNWIIELGCLTDTAKQAIEVQDVNKLGQSMLEAHQYLREFGVSHTVLDDLVKAAVDSGALGAKMTGGGRGGCMIALVENRRVEQVVEALMLAGAHQTWACFLGGEK
jgi:mevalonate kinase